MTQERAVLAGGCFWGLQDLIRRHDGVISTRVSYTGGDVPERDVSQPRHTCRSDRNCLRPREDKLPQAVGILFQIHDPTTRNRQGNDIGTSYRSAIFYTSEEQKRVAEDTIADVNASGLWPGRVVTEIAPAGDFWEAEPEHQDYLERYPAGYICHFIRPDWKLPARAKELRRASP